MTRRDSTSVSQIPPFIKCRDLGRLVSIMPLTLAYAYWTTPNKFVEIQTKPDKDKQKCQIELLFTTTM